MAVTRDDVMTAFRLMLSREATEQQIADHLLRCNSIADLREAILSSRAFQDDVLGKLIPLCKPLDWPAMPVEVEVNDSQLRRMVDRIERNFRHMGETEPHWSVLTADRFLAKNVKEHEDDFYASGAYDVTRLRIALERCGVTTEALRTCFELGCGLGRITRWLADMFPQVIGADISASHLALAKQTMQRFGKSNVNLLQVDTVAALEDAPRFDAFFSVIVLQHNPPPLIAHMLRIVLQKLNPGGIAYFQVPTYRYGYRFDVDAYLATDQRLGEPEMHLLPQHVILRIADRAGCRPLEVREDPSGAFEMISQRFLLQKLN
jgi:SAM-dependent methyltransferase